MENTQDQNQEDLTSETMEEVEGRNSGNGLERVGPEFNQGSPQVLMNLGSFLRDEIIKLQALMADLESKKQRVEKQVQINRDTLEKLSLVEKQAQEVIGESIKVQKENEAIFRQNVKEKTVSNGANESLTLQQIWR